MGAEAMAPATCPTRFLDGVGCSAIVVYTCSEWKRRNIRTPAPPAGPPVLSSPLLLGFPPTSQLPS